MKSIFVLGCNGNQFSPEAREALSRAEIVVGSTSLLHSAPLPETAKKVVLGNNLVAVLPRLIARGKTRQMAILASGDPLFYGIGGSLLRFVPSRRLVFYPAMTAFQQLFAKLGQPWHNASLFSLHARKEIPFRAILRAELAAVYGDASRPAQQLARELIEKFPHAAKRKAAVGCDLSFPEEKIITGTLGQIARNGEAAASLSVLALLPDPTLKIPTFPLGLPDHKYVHYENMITHPEVRAIVLSKLRLRSGVMWDLGAGSGSVGLEAAGLCPELQVHAVEKNPERLAHLRANIQAEGIGNIVAHEGNALDLLSALPPPNRIFIGGGGVELLRQSFDLLLPRGHLVMTGVTVETVSLLSAALPEYRKELLTVAVSRARKIVTGDAMWSAENPITIAVFTQPEKKKK